MGSQGSTDRAPGLSCSERGGIVLAANRHYCRAEIFLILGVLLGIFETGVDEIGGKLVCVFEDDIVVTSEFEAHWNSGHFGTGKVSSFVRRCGRDIDEFRVSPGFEALTEVRET